MRRPLIARLLGVVVGALAALGYVALSIDGSRAGQSTGGPQDTEQAWISVETVTMMVEGSEMVFSVEATPGSRPIRTVDLWFATQIDAFPEAPNDFTSIRLEWDGSRYVGRLGIGTPPPSGPPATPENILYFAMVRDPADFTVTSKMHDKAGEMGFCTDFVPLIEHFPRDELPVEPPPSPNCSCGNVLTTATR